MASIFLWLTLHIALLVPTLGRDKLVFVAEYARHGARHPKMKLAKWVHDPMGLTSAGMRQHYILGRELRKRYVEDRHLISPRYRPAEISLQASSKTRTIASAYAELAGLYVHGSGHTLADDSQRELAVPPNKHNYTEWIKKLGAGAVDYLYQILPVRAMGEGMDILLEPQEMCPAIDLMVKRFSQEHVVERKEHEQKYKGMYKELATATNFTKSKLTMSEATELRDFLICALVEGHSPINESYAYDLITRATEIYQYKKYDLHLSVGYGAQIVSKIMGTPFLTRTRALLLAAARDDLDGNKASELRYAMNVGSDTLMHALLLQLGVNSDKKVVPFASVMLFELFRNASTGTLDDFYVRFTYNQEIDENYSLPEFSRLIENNTYSDADFTRYCHHFGDETLDRPTFSLILIVAISAVLAVFAVGAGVAIYVRRRRRGEKEKAETLVDSATEAPINAP